MRATVVLIVVASSICGCTGEFPHDRSRLKGAMDSYDDNALIEHLESIKSWHVANETGIDSALRPGLAPSALTPRIFTGQCRLTKELKTLWSWHNGGSGPVPFTWYHDFLSLEEAIAEYRWLIINPLVRWDPDFLPIMSFEGEWYAAYCGEHSEIAGPVIHYFLEDGARLTAINMTTFIATMAQALDEGAITWENGGMVADIRKVRDIHRANNPGYEFPYYVPDGP